MTESSNCPKCLNSTRVKKLSAIYATSKDARLAPPSRPLMFSEREPYFRWLLPFFIFCAVVNSYLFSLTGDKNSIIWISMFVLLGIIGVVVAIRRPPLERKKDAEALKIWEYRKGAWDSLYYCELHDLVFNPETGASAPASNYSHLLRY